MQLLERHELLLCPQADDGRDENIEKRFVNFTNHPSNRWEQEQLQAALKYGDVIDIPFPQVAPMADEKAVGKMAKEYAERILKLHPTAVLCQGEFCLAFQVITILREKGITVLAACSERNVKEKDNGIKVTGFEFKQFREYEL